MTDQFDPHYTYTSTRWQQEYEHQQQQHGISSTPDHDPTKAVVSVLVIGFLLFAGFQITWWLDIALPMEAGALWLSAMWWARNGLANSLSIRIVKGFFITLFCLGATMFAVIPFFVGPII